MTTTHTSTPAERNWADLMDALLRENFAAQSRYYLRSRCSDDSDTESVTAQWAKGGKGSPAVNECQEA